MKRCRFMILVFALLILLPLTVQAKGEFEVVLLTDLSSGATMDVAEVAVLRQFFIFDWRRGALDAPEVSTTGYELRRGWQVDGEPAMFDLVIYYPAQAGEATGYLYYAGLLSYDGTLCDMCSEYDRHWYAVTPEAETAFQVLLADSTPLEASVVDSQYEVIFDLIRIGALLYRTLAPS